jgi:hypothetical protein
MKTIHHSTPQRGFFDLGISILVLALAGGFLYIDESSHAERLSTEEQAIADAEQAAPAEVSAGADTVVAGALQ